jgi:hypothetical protein
MRQGNLYAKITLFAEPLRKPGFLRKFRQHTDQPLPDMMDDDSCMLLVCRESSRSCPQQCPFHGHSAAYCEVGGVLQQRTDHRHYRDR